MDCARWQRRGARPLKCSRPAADHSPGGGGAAAARGASPAPEAPPVCRTCWETEDDGDSGPLVAPCACRGSMSYVHTQCLASWQAQLRAQKGIAASRRCDVCKARWNRAHMPPTAPTDWRQMLRDIMRSVPWPAVLECWKFSVLAIGGVRGMQAGVEGFRSGARWAAGSPRLDLHSIARWAPEMALAANTLPPPLKVPVALCFGSFVAGLAAEVAFLSLVCAYAGSLVGFASGVAGSLLFTLRLGSSLLHQGTLAASTLASCALRGAEGVGRLAAPLMLGLLRTLALRR